MKDFIHFFGTTGDKDVFFKGIRSMGGLYLNINDTKIIIDPGANTFYKFINSYKDTKIDGIILSHVHIDHSNDLNIFVEFMTEGGTHKNGILVLPNQAIEDRTLQPYLKSFPEQTHITKTNEHYKIKNLTVIPSIEHKHGIENYGFNINTGNKKIALITDTRYFPELANSYKNTDILIINVPYNNGIKETSKHLDIPSVEKLLKDIKPQKVILTHFGKDILNDNPELIAKSLKEKFEIEVISAIDDMILEL